MVLRNCGTPKLLRNWGPWNSEITPKSFRNYSETGDRDRDRATSEITPKLFRNYGPGLWYSEFTPKLRTVELWNYSEITPKLWDWDRGRGTPKTVACYSPLLVLVCWSVSQDPPRPIEDITVAFGLLYSLSTALSQSAVSYAHAAPGRPISDRLSPDTAVQRAKRSIVRLA